MFFDSYSHINIKPKRKQTQNFYYNPIIRAKNLLSQELQNNFLTSKSKQNNYINYTFSDKKNKYIHNNKSTKNYHKKLNSGYSNKKKLTIVNDYFKKFQKTSSNWVNSLKLSKENNINYISSKNFSNNIFSRNIINNISREFNINNNYYNEEIINKDNISKISNNMSLKTFLNDNNGQTQSKNEPYDNMDTLKEKSVKLNDEIKNLLENTNNISKIKIHSVINTSMPIFKRIKLLKQAKNSINRIQKNIMNSSSSFKTFLDENNISRINNYSLEKNNFNGINHYNIKDYNYNDISNKRPIIIKYLPKPKLSVPKFININNNIKAV